MALSFKDYELLDCGNGRKLERFGEFILDRPSPVAFGEIITNRSLWKSADVRFVEFPRETSKENKKAPSSSGQQSRGEWIPCSDKGATFFEVGEVPPSLENGNKNSISCRPWFLPFSDSFVLELKGSPFGHIGVFPEQAENWARIRQLCFKGKDALGRPLRILNLFGYTGGSALAALSSGAEVTHLDAARTVVAQARRNWQISMELRNIKSEETCTRWIVDDAVKFVKREIKRGSVYDGVILDPPTYGHGARGEVWRFSRDIEPFLLLCLKLLKSDFRFVLLSGHTPRYEYPTLKKILQSSILETYGRSTKIQCIAKALEIKASTGKKLPAGDMALATF